MSKAHIGNHTSSNRVALVTGASRGLGYEIAKQLGWLGYSVIVTSRDAAKGQEAVSQLRSSGKDFAYHKLDVTSEQSINILLEFVLSTYNRLDVLVNNAGVLLDHRSHKEGNKFSIFETPVKTLLDTMNTNVYGPFMTCQSFIPLMQTNNYGRIVNVSSRLGQLSQPSFGTPCYRLSKVALNGVTRIFADETRGTNILVNSVCPGWVKTEMGGPNAKQTPEEAVESIIWLATLDDDGPSGRFFNNHSLLEW